MLQNVAEMRCIKENSVDWIIYYIGESWNTLVSGQGEAVMASPFNFGKEAGRWKVKKESEMRR